MSNENPLLELDTPSKGPIIFGNDVSKIPCFRDSWLYGFSASIFGGIMTFMGTSKPVAATKSACICLVGTTTFYWIYCRYNWMQEYKAAKKIEQLIKEQNDKDILAPSENIEIVSVNNKIG